jgi:hypothetical protein
MDGARTARSSRNHDIRRCGVNPALASVLAYGVSANPFYGCEHVHRQNVISFPGTWRVEYPHTSVTLGGHQTRRTIGIIVTLALLYLVVPLTAAAPPGQIPRIGVLALGSPPASPDWKARSPFVQELRTLGWLDGQNIVLEYRWAEGQPNRLSPLAAELVRLPVDVLVAGSTAAIRAVTHATTTIPIVMVSVDDPLEWGAVATLARPGGNVTGVGGLVLESSSKLLVSKSG